MTCPGIGVIGLGAVSPFYLAALDRIPSLQLVAVCDSNPAALNPFRGHLPCYSDHRQLLEDPGVDAVVVTVPNDAHVGVCTNAVAAGLAVCVEKPLAIDVQEALVLLESASGSGVPVMTAFHRRYNRAVVGLVERLAPAALVESLTIRYFERIEDHAGLERWYLEPARCGGGCVADNGPNAFDLARLILGNLEVVDAAIRRDGDGIDRQASVALTSASGATAHVELDWSYEGECKQLEVHLHDGSTYCADMLAGHQGFKGSLWHEYVGVVTHFGEVLSAKAQPMDGGLPALELVCATYRAEHLPGSPQAGRTDRSC